MHKMMPDERPSTCEDPIVNYLDATPLTVLQVVNCTGKLNAKLACHRLMASPPVANVSMCGTDPATLVSGPSLRQRGRNNWICPIDPWRQYGIDRALFARLVTHRTLLDGPPW